MASGTRSRLRGIVLAVVLFTVIREISIRRHLPDLDDWPRVDGGAAGSR